MNILTLVLYTMNKISLKLDNPKHSIRRWKLAVTKTVENEN